MSDCLKLYLVYKPINIFLQCAPDNTDLTTFVRGNKFFELNNHLGNVLVTITDKKIMVRGCPPCPPWVACVECLPEDEEIYYKADVVTANDYYPFG